MASDVDLQTAARLLADDSRHVAEIPPHDLTATRLLHDRVWRRRFAIFAGAVGIALTALALVLINPRGYIGGGWDDARYIEAIIAWSQHGPQVGTIHWTLRWPLILGNALVVRFFGLERTALMVPAALTYITSGVMLYTIVGRLAGWRAGAIAALALLTIPEIARWSTVIYPDILEMMLWCASLSAFWLGSDKQSKYSRSWLLVSGVAAGVACGLRETSLGLLVIYGIAFLTSYRMPRARYGWLALAALPAPLIEYAIYWHATGDPLYRFHIDMQHVAIPSNDILGKTAAGMKPLFNPAIMSRWIGAGPIHLHWIIDPYLNLLADPMDGFIFNILALAGWALWRARRHRGNDRAEDSLRDLCQALVVVIAANILTNLYVLAVRPAPRMFFPALMAGCALTGIAFAHLEIVWLRRTIASLLTVKLLITTVIADVAPNFTHVADISDQITRSLPEPVHINPVTDLYLKLAPTEFRSRLTLDDTPVGGYYLAVGSLWDVMQSDETAPDPNYHWEMVSQADTGQTPWIVRLFSTPAYALGVPRDIKYQPIEARLYRRTE